MTKSESVGLMSWAERQREKYLDGQREKRARPVPYRRTEPKWGVKGTHIYFKKRGKRMLKCNSGTGEVVVVLRRTYRLMKNSKYNRKASWPKKKFSFLY